MNKEHKSPKRDLENIEKKADSSPKEEDKLVKVKKEHDDQNRYKVTEKPAEELGN